MNEPPNEPETARRPTLSRLMKAGIVAVVFVTAYCVIFVLLPYQREQQFARIIESHGGHIEFGDFAPFWISPALHRSLPLFDRIRRVELTGLAAPPELLSAVGSLTYIESLNGNKDLSNADLERFKGLTTLQRLFLSDTQITDAGLTHLRRMTRLESLFLDRTEVTDAGLAHFSGLARLQVLSLTETQVTDAGLAHLPSLAPLQRLYLNETQITDAGLVHLAAMTSLRELYLSDTGVTDLGLEHLKGLTNLELLRLNHTDVSGAGLENLKGLTNLRQLSLYYTSVTDDDTAMLRKSLPRCDIFN